MLKQPIYLITVLLSLAIAMLIIVPFNSLAQNQGIPIDQWRVHLPTGSMKSLAIGENKVYASSSISAIEFDKSDNTLSSLSKVDGLSDIKFSRIKYHPSYNSLIITYSNGNIDVIKDEQITNVPDLKRKNIIGSKNISHINIFNQYAYFSCDFGLSVFDVIKKEFKDTYSNLSPSGVTNKVYCSAISSDGDSVFLATEKGVLTARNSPVVNLLDYNNWYRYLPSDSIDTLYVKTVASFNNLIFSGINGKGIYVLSGNKWKKLNIPVNVGEEIRSMNVSKNGNQLLMCIDSAVFMMEKDFSYTSFTHQNIVKPSECETDTEGNVWIADLNKGLMKVSGTTLEYFELNYVSETIFDLHALKDGVLAMSGGYNSSFVQLDRYWPHFIFDNENYWHYHLFGGIKDLVDAVYNPHDGKIYFASYGNGLIEWSRDLNATYVYNDLNSNLVNSLTPGSPFVRVTGVDVDSKGNVWVSNHSVPALQPSIHMKNKNGVWQSYIMNNIEGRSPLKITIDDDDNKWILLGGSGATKGLLVFNENGNQQKYLTESSGSGKLPDSKVNCITKDKEGNIWIGTNKGVGVHFDPGNIFTSSTDFSTPIFDGFPLLFDKVVYTIKIDGGNRKWIGTDAGVWLLNKDGTEIISNFTTDNSPLLSNNIIDIEIHPQSGEVFIATDQGMISYRGTATEGEDVHSNVKVFPNPVEPNFNGLVGISGLATNSIVKITDIYGSLIYETKSNGGTAVWNVRDYNGIKAKSGIYLIYSATEDGSDAYVAKVAVVE